jgi:hypothetical protein
MHFRARRSPLPTMPMPEPARVVEGSISAADLALLCVFGIGSEPVRSREQRRQALLLAGYSGSHAVHLIKTSPLPVRADTRHHYRLRAFQSCVPAAQTTTATTTKMSANPRPPSRREAP